MACLGLFPSLTNAQFAPPGFPAGGGFPGMGQSPFQNSFMPLPTGNSASGFPTSPYSQPFFGFPRQGASPIPNGQPWLNGQRPATGTMGLPFAQPTPYWMQTPPAQSYMTQPQAIQAAPIPAAGRAANAPPPVYYQYAPSAAPTNQPPRWVPINGALPRSTGNANTWATTPEAMPAKPPAAPPRWPTP